VRESGCIAVILCVFAVARRVVPLSRKKMTSVISADKLAAVWTPVRALEYLLLSGLLAEAVWFVGQLGDWKTQVMMSAVVHYHRENTANSPTRSVIPGPAFVRVPDLAAHYVYVRK